MRDEENTADAAMPGDAREDEVKVVGKGNALIRNHAKVKRRAYLPQGQQVLAKAAAKRRLGK